MQCLLKRASISEGNDMQQDYTAWQQCNMPSTYLASYEGVVMGVTMFQCRDYDWFPGSGMPARMPHMC